MSWWRAREDRWKEERRTELAGEVEGIKQIQMFINIPDCNIGNVC